MIAAGRRRAARCACLATAAAWFAAARPALAQQPGGVLAGVTALRDAYLSAYNAGDATAMGALYAENAVRMPYDAPAQTGRDAIIASYSRAFARRRVDPTLTFRVVDLLIRDDLAVERGRYTEVLRGGEGRATRVEIGKYVTVMRRGRDGGWRFTTTIFNRDAAPVRPASPSAAARTPRKDRTAPPV